MDTQFVAMIKSVWFFISKTIFLSIIFSFTLICSSCQKKEDTEWLKKPVEVCIKTNEEIIGKAKKISVYCNCMVPKIYALVKDDKEKLELLKKGDLQFLNNNPEQAFIDVMMACLPLEEELIGGDRPASEWFDKQKELGFRNTLKSQFDNTNFAETNNLDQYCRCVLNGIKVGFTIKEIHDPKMEETEKYKRLDQHCRNKSRR